MGAIRKSLPGIGFIDIALLCCALFLPLSVQAQSGRSYDAGLKNACIGATLRAIGLETNSYLRRLEAARNGSGNPANIPAFERRIEELKFDFARFAAMSADEYTLPGRNQVTVSPTRPCGPGDILEVDGMTRSGPFYHIVGIQGDDFSALKPGRALRGDDPAGLQARLRPPLERQRVRVCPQLAGRPDPQPSPASRFSLDPRQTGEEILEGLSVGPGTFTVRVGSNGCTDKGSFRVDIVKAAGISVTSTHYILTLRRIKPDECKAFLVDGTTLTWDLAKDLGLGGECTFSVANRLYHHTSSSSDPRYFVDPTLITTYLCSTISACSLFRPPPALSASAFPPNIRKRRVFPLWKSTMAHSPRAPANPQARRGKMPTSPSSRHLPSAPRRRAPMPGPSRSSAPRSESSPPRGASSPSFCVSFFSALLRLRNSGTPPPG